MDMDIDQLARVANIPNRKIETDEGPIYTLENVIGISPESLKLGLANVADPTISLYDTIKGQLEVSESHPEPNSAS